MWQGAMLYGSLTGLFDLRRMRDHIVGYGKFMSFSVAALSMSACARMHLSDPTLFAVEPKLGEAPETAATVNKPRPEESEAEHLQKLEAQVAALGAEVADLRTALAILDRQLPDRQTRPRPAALPLSFPEVGKPAPMSHLYAPPPAPAAGRSLFFEAELGSFRSRQAAEDCWRHLAGEAAMAGLNPRFTITGAETRLAVGPLHSEAAVSALQVETSTLSGPCRGLAPARAY